MLARYPGESTGFMKSREMNESAGFWLFGMFLTKDFLIPFYATVSAALVLLLLQFVSRKTVETRKKLYGASYILDASLRMQKTSCVLLRQTVLPHIESIKRILEGNSDLLEDMFMADEFDILTDPSIRFDVLSQEHKELLGCDSIELIQIFETLNYLSSNEVNERNLNKFVTENLKSRHTFIGLDEARKTDVLNTYWDMLESIKHANERLLSFVSFGVAPKFESYVAKARFRFFRKSSCNKSLADIRNTASEFAEVYPDSDFIKRSVAGGIRNVL